MIMQRRRWTALLAVCAAGAVFAGSPALGDPAGDKRRVDAQLAQAQAALEGSTARVQSAATRFFEANRQLPAARSALASAQGQVAAAQVLAGAAARKAAVARAQVAIATAHLTDVQRQVEGARDLLAGFAAQAYMGEGAAGFSAVLDSKSPSDLATRLAYLDTVSGEQRQALDRVTRTLQAAADVRSVVTARKNAAEAADSRARAALTGARTAAESARAATDRVAALVGQRKEALAVADQERAADSRRTTELQAESDRIAAQLRAISAAHRARNRTGGGGGSVPAGSGYFLMPVNGWKSSDFGYRYDPYFHRWQLHAGTDFAAASGTSIYAAAAGTVVRAGWNGGYGNYTCIYHGQTRSGQGIATCYAHQSAIVVSSGQQVARGQLIGRVGTTGASTGAHLHFEVRLDGTPVNPLGYL
jgi:murein DD-endopeptidase MepM/ murein hydrolase activator NlpD